MWTQFKKILKLIYFLQKIFLLWFIPQCWPFVLLALGIFLFISNLWLIIIPFALFAVAKYLGKCGILFLRRPPGIIKWSLEGPIATQKYVATDYLKGRKRKTATRLAYKFNNAMNVFSDEYDVDMNKIFNFFDKIVHCIPNWCLIKSEVEKKKYENYK